MPTAEKGKSSVSETRVRSEEEEVEEDENRGLTAADDDGEEEGEEGSEAVLIAALAITSASSEMSMSWRRPLDVERAGRVGVLLRKASPERVTRRVLEEAEEEAATADKSVDDDKGDEWLLPARSRNVTLPIKSYAEQVINEKLSTIASTMKENGSRSGEEGRGGRIVFPLFSFFLRRQGKKKKKRGDSSRNSYSLSCSKCNRRFS